MVGSLTHEGIAAFKSGDKVKARYLLRAAIHQNTDDVQAWLWLAGAVESDQERLDCLARVLILDSRNEQASKGLSQMVAQGKTRLIATAGGPSALAPGADRSASSESSTEYQDKQYSTAGEITVFQKKPALLLVILTGGVGFLVVFFASVFLVSLTRGGVLESISIYVVVILLAMVVLATCYGLLTQYFMRYTLTTRRLIVETGVLSRSKQAIPLQRIQNVSYRQSPLKRLIGLGDVLVESAGEQGEIRLQDLAECRRRTEQILDQVDLHLRRS